MGLALRPGRNKLFISYRAADGKASAKKIHECFERRGYEAWLDEANDFGGNPNLELGVDVQKEIEARLEDAQALVLIDSPKANESSWVRFEVETAVGKMIPIYPVVLHPKTEATSASRFRVLSGLHRRICIASESDGEKMVFDNSELPNVVDNVEQYLMNVYRNRVVQPRALEKLSLIHI